MKDTDCTAFLRWALPQLELRWPGFRKVRRQVCKRLKQRMRDLGLDNYSAYRARLEADAAEWRILDECCHITISRFFRDRGIFEVVRRQVLPAIAARAKREGRDAQVWSAGCASGEEPFTLKFLWDIGVASGYPGVSLSIIASDVDVRADNVTRLRTRLIPQGANIPCTREAEQVLHERGVLVVPDFIANAGGMICASIEYRGAPSARPLTISMSVFAPTRALS